MPRKPVAKDGEEFGWTEMPREDGDEPKLKPIPGDKPQVVTKGGRTIIIIPPQVEAAIKEDPKSPMYWQDLGEAYADQKNGCRVKRHTGNRCGCLPRWVTIACNSPGTC